MNNSFKDSKAEILAKLHSFKKNESDLNITIPYNTIFPQISDKEAYFKESFTKLGGTLFETETMEDCFVLIKEQVKIRNLKNVLCLEPEFEEKLIDVAHFQVDNNNDFEQVEATITACEALISRTGSILVSSKSASGRRMNVIPNSHFVIAYKSQILVDIMEGISFIQEKYAKNQPSMISLISGPSRTADIEKTLVMGAHGPKEILLFLVNK